MKLVFRNAKSEIIITDPSVSYVSVGTGRKQIEVLTSIPRDERELEVLLGEILRTLRVIEPTEKVIIKPSALPFSPMNLRPVGE